MTPPDPTHAAIDRLAQTLRAAAGRCTLSDARRLWRGLRGLRAARPGGFEEALARWNTALRRAEARYAERLASVPRPTYPSDLPVAEHRAEILAALRAHRVLVLCGDTGSGKSTQLPKLCLEAGRGVAGAIAHTQPRRIAARSVAARIAEELRVPLGGVVGVKTRFDDRTGPGTLLSVMTDGLLLAETRHDRDLLAYDTIIVDEAHERSLNIDFLLGYLTRLLERRRDLQLVVTSATIDPERFSRHFGDAPILSVAGRMYPIETRYRPIGQRHENDEEDPDVLEAIASALEEIDQSPRDAASGRKRDVLVFLSGEREIRETADVLRGRAKDSEVVPLYARLSSEEQDRVFRPSVRRRIVLATNVAETSITVPGIDAVIDPGLARISRYSPRGRVQRLPIEPVAQASADQRKGRCGRTGPGLCIRLYGEEDFAARPRFTQPEILRTNLASVILQMASLGLGRPEEFPFIDPPSQRLIQAGYETLIELGAMSRRHELTQLGRRMAHLPIDPRLSRMVLAAIDEHCLEEVLVIAAALSVQDPRERPIEKAEAADFAQARFRDERSDFLGFLKLWKAWREQGESLGSSALRRWCRDHFLSWLRMREWGDVHRQLRELVRERILPGYAQASAARGEVAATLAEGPDPNPIHRALLAGLVANVGTKGEKNEYRTAAGSEFFLHPSSVLAKRTPPWVMAAEIVETSRRYARLCAKIQGDWIEKIAPHLCQTAHFEPHWLKDAGQVAAWERVGYGALTVVPKRRVPFGPIDAASAREIFLRSGLVDGEIRTQGAFLAHNANLRAAIERMQEKKRHAGLLVESEARFQFYDARVPPEVHSTPSFEKWRREAERRQPDVLRMRPEDLLSPGAPTIDVSRFPDELTWQGTSYELRYRHAPGELDDGVTMLVPVALANRVPVDRLEWLVPGLLEEKVAALLKVLPKRLRVRFQPAAEFASGAAEQLAFGEGSLPAALAAYLGRLTGVAVAAADFDLAGLPAHLRMRLLVLDDQGKPLGDGRDPVETLAPFRSRAALDFHRAARGAQQIQRLLRSGMRDWECEAIPDEVRFQSHGVAFVGYLALASEPSRKGPPATVGVQLLERRDEALATHRAGLRRLLVLRASGALRHHVEYLPNLESMALAYSPLGSREELEDALAELAVELGFLARVPSLPRDPQGFLALLRVGEDHLFEATRDAAALAEAVLRARHETAKALDGAHAASWAPAVARMQADLARLVPKDVFRTASVERLRQLPRYLAAIRSRLRKLAGHVDRDRELEAEVDAWRARRVEIPASADPRAVEQFDTLLEEFQVQRFAGELRTATPVSPERLEAALRGLVEPVVRPAPARPAAG